MKKGLYGLLLIMTTVTACVMSFTPLMAQDQPYNEEITVVAPYNPTISEASKININPKIPEIIQNKKELLYSIHSTPVVTFFELQPVTPLAMTGDSLKDLQRNDIRFGFGNYLTPYLEFHAGTLRSPTHSLGIHFRHLSSGAMKGYPNSSHSDNEAGLAAERYFKNHTLTGDLSFDRQVVHFYGYDQNKAELFDVSEEQLRQRFINVGAGVRYASNYTDASKLNHAIGFGYHYLADRYQTMEHRFKMDLSLDKAVKVIRAVDKQTTGLTANLDYYHDADSLTTLGSGIFSVQPYLETSFNEYTLYLGLKASFRMDTSSKAYLYPLAELRIRVVDEILQVYAGISGEVYKNSVYSLSGSNPYIISTIPLDYTRDRFRFYGGINGHIGKNVDYNASVSSSFLSRMPFFVNDTSTARNKELDNQFTVVYDDVKKICGKADISYSLSEKLHILLSAGLYQYFTDKEQKPWQTRPYDISLTGSYAIRDKFRIYAGVKTYGPSYARTFNTVHDVVAKKLKGITDASCGLEYRIFKNFTAFVDLNNILNVRYAEWNNYVNQKFNFLIGASYAF
jgi:hypothetical protein